MRQLTVRSKCGLFSLANTLPAIAAGIVLIISYLIYGQEKPEEPGDQVSTAMSQETAAKEKIKDRHRKYAQWLRSNVDVLVPEAKQRGFAVSAEDLSAQQNAFRSFFPGLNIVEYEIENEILARNYARNLYGVTLLQETIDNAYNKLKTDYLDGSIPSLEDIRQMVETRALMETHAVMEELNALRKRNQINRNENHVKESQTWPSASMRFKAPDSYCLAHHTDSAHCLLTVGQFNQIVKYYFIPQRVSLDTARQYALNELLSDMFLSIKAREKGFQNKNDLNNVKKGWLDWIGSSITYKGIGPPQNDPAELRRVYQEYHHVLFSERFSPYYSIIGSTDSLCIDSLLKAIRNQKKDTLTSGSKKGPAFIKSKVTAVWSSSCGKLLPEDFFNATDSLQIDSISGVIRTPYGYFIVKLDSIHVREEIGFEDATKDCIFLATKQKWQNLDSVLEEKAYALYKSDVRLNRESDTLELTAFLLPICSQPPICRCIAANKKPSIIDSMDPGIRLQSTVLPIEIRNDLLDKYKKTGGKKKLIGPLHTRLGVWYFKVIGCKVGTGKIPFSRAKKELIDSLVARTMDSAVVDFPFETPDSALDAIAFSRCFAPYFFGRADDDSTYTGEPSGNGAIENPKSRSDRIFQRGKKEMEKWIAKIKVTLP